MFIFANETVRIPEGFKVYNLSSILEVGERLVHLLPSNNGDLIRTCRDISNNDMNKAIDIFFLEFIFNNRKSFVDFIRPIYDMYLGFNVYVLVGDGEFNNNFTEFMIKLIQQRYGFTPYYINEESDLELVQEVNFSIEGLYNFDMDKIRWFGGTS